MHSPAPLPKTPALKTGLNKGLCHQGNISLNNVHKGCELCKYVEKLCAELSWVKKIKATVYLNQQASEMI